MNLFFRKKPITNTDEEVCLFVEWCNKNFNYDSRINEWFKGDDYHTTQDLLNTWKSQIRNKV